MTSLSNSSHVHPSGSPASTSCFPCTISKQLFSALLSIQQNTISKRKEFGYRRAQHSTAVATAAAVLGRRVLNVKVKISTGCVLFANCISTYSPHRLVIYTIHNTLFAFDKHWTFAAFIIGYIYYIQTETIFR